MKPQLHNTFPILLFITSLALSGCFEKKKEEVVAAPSAGGGSGGGSLTPAKVFVPYANDTHGDTAVIVSNVTDGETVTLYSDSNCSTSISSVSASGTMAVFSVTGLSSGSTTSFYAKSTSTSCSTLYATYQVTACPAGYAKVEGNPEVGIKPFCVMKFEAKNVAGTPTSQAALAPWMDISATDAKAECQSLNSGGATNYDLISSLEWSTLAYEIQNQDSNWSSSTQGAGYLSYGNSNNEKVPMAVADINDPWSGTTNGSNPTTAFEYRRTYNLSNGDVVWDLAGNAQEIVDYGMQSTYTSPPNCSNNTEVDASGIGNSCPNTPAAHYTALNPSWSITAQFPGTVQPRMTANAVLLRGGGYNYMNKSGSSAYHMSVANITDAFTGSKIGFRCVYRLNPVTKSATQFASDFTATPTINFTGAQAGETINLYKDSKCTTSVGSSQATSSTFSFSTNAVSAGAHTLYYSATSLDGYSSACQPQQLVYQFATCPSGFISVSGNASRSVNPFCVMQFEARRTSGGVISTDPADSYNSNVYDSTSKNECINMNTNPNTNYNLINNQEWMTIADSIYNVASNWSGSAVGSGFLNHGVAMANNGGAVTTDINDPYSGFTVGFATMSDFRYKRTHTLSNGNIIWDFAGNRGEVVDWGSSTSSSGYVQAPACASGDSATPQEFQTGAATCPGLAATDYMPYSSSANSAQYVGQLYPWSSQGTLIRGGHYDEGVETGIYAYRAVAQSTYTQYLGFRCVYRP